MSKPIPHLHHQGTAVQLMDGDQPFIMLSGEVHNSSASSLAYMDNYVWPELQAMHCNSAIVPLYWELIEPREGQFDFSLIDGLLNEARLRGLKLVLLWFATWKNAESWYTPEWVKLDLDRFQRAQTTPGVNAESISCFSNQACSADAKAFARVMEHIQANDEQHRTVLAMQVQNEVGLLGGPRDRSPLAEEAFFGPVPPDLLAHMADHQDDLVPWLKALWKDNRQRSSGSWTEVFGAGAAEVFMAWFTARYVEQVTAAGKAVYPLPMFVNTWLVQHDDQPAGEHPSGGPTHRVLNVWQAAAPSIDFAAPDIYLPCFKQVCRQYTQAGNPLMIPEAKPASIAAANVFYALGQHDAICFAPFGIEDASGKEEIAEAYAFLQPFLPVLAKHQGLGRTAGILDEEGHTQSFHFGSYCLRTSFWKGEAEGLPGRGFIVQLAEDEFLIAGAGFSLHFESLNPVKPHASFLSMEEGTYEHGHWRPGRRLNGDERERIFLKNRLTACRVRLYLHE